MSKADRKRIAKAERRRAQRENADKRSRTVLRLERAARMYRVVERVEGIQPRVLTDEEAMKRRIRYDDGTLVPQLEDPVATGGGADAETGNRGGS